MIEDWKRQPLKNFERQDVFLKSLKKRPPRDLDLKAEKIHNKVFSKLNCLECANCCTSIPPIVNRVDTKRISNYLGLSERQFHDQYLRIDEDGDVVMNQSPCPFLDKSNACGIYEIRPKACRTYPHTDHYEFSRNINLHAKNNRTCPAVYNIIERLRHLV